MKAFKEFAEALKDRESEAVIHYGCGCKIKTKDRFIKNYVGTLCKKHQQEISRILHQKECVNEFGFLGFYQFGKPRLWDLGLSIDGWKPRWWSPQRLKQYKVYIISEIEFLLNSDLQDTIFRAHIQDLRKQIQKKYSKHYGCETWDIWGMNDLTVLSGGVAMSKPNIIITESGLVAGAHLKGLGGVKQFLKGNDNVDALGTKISEYIEKFAGYEL